MENSEESTNDKMSEDRDFLEFYFPCPSNQRDCLMKIAQQAWGVAETLEEYEPDYIQELIEIYSGKDSTDPADIIDDKITVYSEVNTHIGEDVVSFRNECHHFLEAFYQQKEKVIELIEHDFVLHSIIKVISIFEEFLAKLGDTLSDCEDHLCYAMYDGYFKDLESIHGKNAIKHFKKYAELTTKEYEFAFEEITAFMNYINESKFSSKLNELARRLAVFCELKIDNSEAEGAVARPEDQRPLTLIKFMQKYCEKQKMQLLRYRRKSLNDANLRKSITLPEPIRNWKTGQAKYYKASDLKEKWPSYCEILPNLPPLKQ